ncbi:hypothetical protein [Stenotrophomonas sp.]|uniref:hypothetical protein n=1 Tax=Stenotrophomonas sp. TaxID=69392 RepID=UPI0028A6221F|nr:hypothetical protein [Stenotrophomonas sp.]
MSDKYVVVIGPLLHPCSSNVVFDDGVVLVQGRRSDEAVVLGVEFPSVEFLGVSDEGSRLRLLMELGGIRGALLKSQEGSLRKYFADESMHTRDGIELAHYTFMIGEEIIDVITQEDPVIHVAPL